MRPGRILLFLFAVVLLLSMLAVAVSPERSVYFKKLIKKDAGSQPNLAVEENKTENAGTETPVDSIIPEQVTASEDVNTSKSSYPGTVIEDSLKAGHQVRIIFYGDSQLEGDRITSLLRYLLRTEGGGSGPGMIAPVMPVLYTRSFVVKPSSNWKRYTLLDNKNGRFPDNALGPLLSVCRFTEPGDKRDTPENATVTISPVPGADKAVSRYDRLRILYGKNTDKTTVTVSSGAMFIASSVLKEGEGPYDYSLKLPSAQDVNISFSSCNSPDIYALSLESDTGIIVDNVPVRGSAGLEFVMTDSTVFRKSLGILNPDMIILQYGLNVVRNVRSNYRYYEEGLVRQIEYLRKVSGGAPILLVSLTDMANKSGDTISSFTNIPAIRDAQRRAAARTGIYFWDAWISMGGQGSIVKWYEQVPALASKDLTHLSNPGADTIASRLFNEMFLVRKEGNAGVSNVIHLKDTIQKTIPAETVIPVKAEKHVKLLSWLAYNPQQSFIFTTPAFWIFFLVVMAGLALTGRRRAMCHTWLLLVSLYFYYKAGGLFFILLVFTCTTTYLTAILTGRARTRFTRRLWLTTNIIILLGLLSYFKYSGFIADSINALFGTSFRSFDFFSALSNGLLGTHFDVSNIVLPVGISFFTFQALSYNIDVYRGKIAPVTNFVDLSFYKSFFPQLVAGPIVRATEFFPQMRGDYSITKNEFGHALFLILQGLIKKMIISDFISVNFVDRVFDAPALYSGFENLMAVYGYGMQIYCDFSGYTDIAIGVALLMGFRLPLNFNSPYKAANISDFWKRWHISLSRWLKDYLYIPLGGNRKGKIRTGINLMVTMLLGGLWHGAAFRFVIWGGLHGFALIINKIWQGIFAGVNKRTRIARLAGILITFNFVSFAWIFFRAGSNKDAFVMLSQMFSSFNPGDYRAVLSAYMPVLILIASGYVIHFLPVSVKEAYRGLFIRLPLVIKFLVVIGVCFVLHKVCSGPVQPFIYFRF